MAHLPPSLRRRIADLHSWIGAVAALFIIVASLTGGVIAMASHLMHAETGALPRDVGPAPALPDLDGYLDAAQAEAGPEFIALGYLGPDAEIATPVGMVWGLSAPPDGGGREQIVTLDPATGDALGTFFLYDTLTHALIDFHAELLAGPVGAVLMAVLGLLMGALALAGLVLAKPLRRTARGTASRRWHRVAGVWLAVPVLLWGVSGAYWSQPDWARGFAPFPADLTAAQTARLSATCGNTVSATPVSANQALATATTAIGADASLVLREAEFEVPWQPYHLLVFANGTNPDARGGNLRAFVSASCADVVELQPIRPAGTVGALLISIHTGEFLGPLRQPALLVLGLLLAAISATGTLMWWRRIRKQRRTRRAALTAVLQ